MTSEQGRPMALMSMTWYPDCWNTAGRGSIAIMFIDGLWNKRLGYSVGADSMSQPP